MCLFLSFSLYVYFDSCQTPGQSQIWVYYLWRILFLFLLISINNITVVVCLLHSTLTRCLFWHAEYNSAGSEFLGILLDSTLLADWMGESLICMCVQTASFFHRLESPFLTSTFGQCRTPRGSFSYLTRAVKRCVTSQFLICSFSTRLNDPY